MLVPGEGFWGCGGNPAVPGASQDHELPSSPLSLSKALLEQAGGKCRWSTQLFCFGKNCW